MTTDSAPTMIGRIIGHYRIVEEIGRGGMGVVYRARDENLRRDVALKLLPPHTLASVATHQRSRREALALSRLNHPGVAVLHDFISTPEGDCIVMELVSGDSLDRTLGRGPMPEREVVRLGIQLAEGLAAAHTSGVVHRDLKPANLRVTGDGRLKILDFGLARRLLETSESREDNSDVSRAVVGTPSYVAPEVWRGEAATAASDLYAAGVVLYEMATGVHPFRDLGGHSIAQATLHLAPRAPRALNPALSPDLEAVILTCMEKDPSRRFASASDLAQALGALQSGTSRPAARRTWTAPRAVTAGVVVLALGALMVGVWRGWWRPHPHPAIQSLAVLPLANLTGDPAQEYLADGLTDELISSLGEYSAIRVISRTSSMHYKGTAKTLPTVAGELGVDAVIQGSLQSSADRLRVSVQLIDGRIDRQLWSRHYEGDRHQALAIQSRVANAIAREIGLRLGDAGASMGGRQPVDPAAYQLYLQGRFHWNRRSEDGIRRAISYFDRAIAKDSLYALAYCGLADAWSTAALSGMLSPTQAYPNAKRAALRALALDPELSAAYVSLANIRQNFDWDWEGAAGDYRRAIALNDNNELAHHWYANHLALQGRFDSAMVEVRRAQELDPLSLPIGAGAGAFLYFARRYDEALGEYQRVAQIDSTSTMLCRAMAADYLQLGRPADAARAIQRWLESQYPGPLPLQVSREYRRAGIPGMLRVLVAALEAKRSSGRYEPATHVAELYALLGRRDLALQWLDVALQEHDTELNRLKVDPIFDILHGDPRYEAILRRVGLGRAA